MNYRIILSKILYTLLQLKPRLPVKYSRLTNMSEQTTEPWDFNKFIKIKSRRRCDKPSRVEEIKAYVLRREEPIHSTKHLTSSEPGSSRCCRKRGWGIGLKWGLDVYKMGSWTPGPLPTPQPDNPPTPKLHPLEKLKLRVTKHRRRLQWGRAGYVEAENRKIK